jgi:hypothetical protein
MKKLLLLTICCIISSISTYAYSFILKIGICEVKFTILPTFDRTVELSSVMSYEYNNLTPPNEICLNIPISVEYNSHTYTVTSIAKYALRLCPPKLYIPKTISNIGTLPFGDDITMLAIDEENPYFKCIDGIIYDKSETEAVTCLRNVKTALLPNTITAVRDSAFYGSSLETISLSEKVERLGDAAFKECENMHKIILPESILQIGSSCFMRSGIESIVLPSQISEIKSETFHYTPLKDIIIPECVTNIGSHAFANSELTNIILPKSLGTIGSSAFYETPLTEIELPSGIRSIDDDAFCRSKLKSVNIPASVNKIGYNAFCACVDLEKVIFEGEYCDFGHGTFGWCESLNIVNLPSNTLIISDGMFEGCSALKEIKLPSSCTTISYGAFKGCSSLSNIEFPSSMTSIGSEAFAHCDALDKIDLPKNLEKIWQSAFDESRIVELRLPESLTYIAKNAFSNCKIQSIYCGWNIPPTFENIWCEWNYKYSNLYVPIGSEQKYKSTYPWHQFYNITEFESSGIDDITEESSRRTSHIFNIQGQSVSSEYKGIIIIKYSDGATVKLVNK